MSIRGKLLSSFVGLIVMVILFVAIYYPQRQTEVFLERLKAEAVSAATLLAYHLSPAVEFNDLQTLRNGLRGVELLQDVRSLGIYDLGGKLLVGLGAAPKKLQAFSDLPDEAVRSADRLIVRRPIIGIEGDRVGFLSLETSLERLKAKQREQVLDTVIVGVVILLLGLLVAWLLQRVVVQPISRVTQGVERIAQGDLTTPAVEVNSKDELGKLASAFNMMRDRLRTTTVSKEFLDNILASMADMLIVLGPDGEARAVNRAFLELLAVTEQDVLGKRVDQLELGPLQQLSEEIVAEGLVRDHRVTLRSRDGELLPVVVNGTRVLNGKGDVEAVVLVARDMRETHKLIQAAALTEAEKKKAAELARAYEQLDDAHRELKEAQAKIIASGRLAAVGQLAAGVAHEINNPLSAVMSYAILLQQRLERLPGHLSEALGDFPRKLQLIKIGAERCKVISDNLLMFARESKREMGALQLRDVVERTFDLIGAQLSQLQVEVHLEVPDDLRVWGSDSELQQILTNLAINGAQAMPEGGKLTVKATPAPDGLVNVEIADCGAGIPPEHLEQIFDPFFTTKAPGEGTGLGLSIVHGLVQKHGGTISFSSELSKGTTVLLRLPSTRSAPEVEIP